MANKKRKLSEIQEDDLREAKNEVMHANSELYLAQIDIQGVPGNKKAKKAITKAKKSADKAEDKVLDLSYA